MQRATCAQERTAASPVRREPGQMPAATDQQPRYDDGHRLEENPDTVDNEQGLKRRQRSCKVCAVFKVQPRKFTKYFCPDCSTGNRR
jgi:hypothetical protein